MTEINTNLIGKSFDVPEINTRRFDNSEEYVVVKKTRKGEVKVLKPEVIDEIKHRLETE